MINMARHLLAPKLFNPALFSIELIFTIAVILLCLLIYFRTKEIFKLTKHKGVYYFRNTFLYFALAYVFRFFLILFQLYMISVDIRIPRHTLMPFFLVITSYLSTMAIVMLTLSVIWKKAAKYEYSLHFLALCISLFAFFTRSTFILILLQAVLLVFTVITSYFSHKKSKKFSKLMAIYFLLFIFWILSLSSLSARRFVPFGTNFIAQTISLVIFLIIYLKVKKWTK